MSRKNRQQFLNEEKRSNHHLAESMMTQGNNRSFGFSLRTLLLVTGALFVAVVVAGNILVHRTSVVISAFGTTLNGLHGADNVKVEFERWLATQGFVSCKCPAAGFHNRTDSWYAGEADGTDILVNFQLNERNVGATVHASTNRWIFTGSRRTDELPKLRARIFAYEIGNWWEENSTLLKPHKQQ